MNRSLRPRSLALCLILFLLGPSALPAQGQGRSEALTWESLPDLPDSIGFGGPLAGVHQNVLIVAGGANFPGDPPWSVDGRPPGEKVWHDRIFALTAPTAEDPAPAWKVAGRLPYPCAYAPTVSTDEGVYILGGEVFGPQPTVSQGGKGINQPSREVLRLQWNPDGRQVDVIREALPPLPRPCQYHAAALLGQRIYVAASHAHSPMSQQLDEMSFWMIDLAEADAMRSWKSLPGWPGAPREKMALIAQQGSTDADGIERALLYLIGGSTWARHVDGSPDDARATHFADGYRFDPDAQSWTRIADLPAVSETRQIDTSGYTWNPALAAWQPTPSVDSLTREELQQLFAAGPRPLGAAPAVELGTRNILLFSGATGRYVTMQVQDRPIFPTDVLLYDTHRDEWSRLGEMPVGVVTTVAVRWGDRIVIPSGETRPGVRTPAVKALRLPASN